MREEREQLHAEDGEVLDLRPLRLPAWLARREVRLPRGAALSAEEEPWRDEIVALEQGAIDVVGRCGRVVRFVAGAVLTFEGVPFAEVRCAGEEPAVLVAVRRSPRPP